jgi:hypothetical protein
MLDPKNSFYNNSKLVTGDSLRTLKGSTIQRYQGNVGKYINGKLYFHKQYAEELLTSDQLEIVSYMDSIIPFDYNCITLNMKSNTLSLVEAPDFDTAREPVVGRIFYQAAEESTNRISNFYTNIWHHKWLWVKNDYEGFDVRESWEWSKKWLSVLVTMAEGSNNENWLNQLSQYGLQ